MVIFVINDRCILLKVNRLQKVRKCLFLEPRNLLIINLL